MDYYLFIERSRVINNNDNTKENYNEKTNNITKKENKIVKKSDYRK